MDESLESIARRCAESHLSELGDIDSLTVVEVADVDLSDVELDTVVAHCGKIARHFKDVLDRIDLEKVLR